MRLKKYIRRMLLNQTPANNTPGLKTLRIHDISLDINPSDNGGTQYDSKSSYEEYVSPLYAEVAKSLDPKLVIDIGANYGFTGVVFGKRFPEAKLVLVEPSPLLEDFIRRNLSQNGITNYELIAAACGKSSGGSTSFALNPSSSQDNRVKGGSDWKTVVVPMRDLTSIAVQHHVEGGVFIKIDTQGFEQSVFEGGSEFLEGNSKWLAKSEFAPHWLLSQGTDPHAFLHYLIDKYAVAEAPQRYRHNADTLDQIFAHRLTHSSVDSFMEYVVSLNRDQLGWCDILISPKTSKWA